jgi:uronate dehydrogenase
MIVVTGAAGEIGTWLAPRLAARGLELRLSDISEVVGKVKGTEFVRADLTQADAIRDLCKDATAIIHLGGIRFEAPSEQLIASNVLGTDNIFRAARLAGARVVYASSNHVIGYYERNRDLSTDDPFRPDSIYGVTKAAGELIARFYFDRYRVESASIRIGSALERPTRVRHRHTWVSYDDLEALIIACLQSPNLGCRTFWGVSANTRKWWQDDSQGFGFVPKDDAEKYVATLLPDPDDPQVRRFQGGEFCTE